MTDTPADQKKPDNTPLLEEEAILPPPMPPPIPTVETNTSTPPAQPVDDLIDALTSNDTTNTLPSTMPKTSFETPAPVHDDPPASDVPPSPPKPRITRKGIVVASLLLVLLTLPLIVYFVSQQQQLAGLRSRAVDGPYPNGQVCTSNSQCLSGNCQLGPLGTRNCVPAPTQPPTQTNPSGVCGEQGADCSGSSCTGTVTINVCTNGPTSGGPCDNIPGGPLGGPICDNPVETRTGTVDCVEEANRRCAFVQIDTPNGSGVTCYPTNCNVASPTPPPGSTPGPTSPPGGTPNPTNPPGGGHTPTPTTHSGGACETIRVYDEEGTDITTALRNQTRTLSIGETVTLATTKGSATKARFRIQGITQFAENNPTITTSNEYRLAIEIPSNITQANASFEVEVLINGNWK